VKSATLRGRRPSACLQAAFGGDLLTVAQVLAADNHRRPGPALGVADDPGPRTGQFERLRRGSPVGQYASVASRVVPAVSQLSLPAWDHQVLFASSRRVEPTDLGASCRTRV